MRNLDEIRSAVEQASRLYPVKRVDLFGSYADGSANEGSDVDLLVEFAESPVSLLKICGLQDVLSELLQLDVDIVESPLAENSNLVIDRRVCVYGA